MIKCIDDIKTMKCIVGTLFPDQSSRASYTSASLPRTIFGDFLARFPTCDLIHQHRRHTQIQQQAYAILCVKQYASPLFRYIFVWNMDQAFFVTY